jgi:exodeoxyribonuclease-3
MSESQPSFEFLSKNSSTQASSGSSQGKGAAGMKLPLRLASWNVNGIRAAGEKGLFEYFKQEDADILCLQETKATLDQLKLLPNAEEFLHPNGYASYWHSGEKLGYSGVSIYSRKEPKDIHYGIGDPLIDREGRVIIAEYEPFTLINAYFPNSQRDHARLDFKLYFCKKFLQLCETLRSKGQNLVICGDFNIAHNEVDLANPKTNQDNAGFLPEERAWMTEYIAAGYVDTFRKFTQGSGHYTWWSYRPGVRQKNIGWRLDYFFTSREFGEAVSEVRHRPEVLGSDHCPVMLQLRS